jgi:hypothetical protein
MRPRLFLTVLLTVLFVILSGCGTAKNCPVCGTTKNGAYAVLNVIPVEEHNNTGEPGGPFNSFDISWINTPPSGGLSGTNNLDYVSDRIGIAVQVVDTVTDINVYSIAGQNGVSGGGNNASPCVPVGADPVSPPIVSVLGNWVRFGCRTGAFHIPGYGASGNFGGFAGGQCCAARANQINPLAGPNGMVITPDGNTMYVADGSSSVVALDLTAMNLTTGSPETYKQPTALAVIPTGLSPDYDGQLGNSAPWPGAPAGTLGNTSGAAGCALSSQGRAFSDPSCGDLRADEMSYDPKDQILAVINGDPGLPYITFIDVSGINARTSNCQPFIPGTPYGPPLGNALGIINNPTCILGQIYYDGAPQNNTGVPVDNIGLNLANGFACPDPSNPEVNSGMSGPVGYVTGQVPCHHGPIIDIATGNYDPNCDPTASGAICAGAIGPAGLGGQAWNPANGHFLLPNGNSTVTLGLTVGSLDDIDPRPGNPNGPVVVNSYPMLNCMPTSITQGPGTNFLVGCADHDGKAFPANEYIINAAAGNAINCSPGIAMVNCVQITNVGGVDQTWYNPGDNKYYLAARDMLPGPVMGVIDAGTNQWLVNLPVGTNAHSVAVDPNNNHVFMPQQAGAICGTVAASGCIDVIGEQ